MSDLRTFRIGDRVEVHAVQFDGSTTHKSAIEHWMETGEYNHPTMRTADIISFEITDFKESVAVTRMGDWVVKLPVGAFLVAQGRDAFDDWEDVTGESE